MAMADSIVFLGICLVVASAIIAAAAVICCCAIAGKRVRSVLAELGTRNGKARGRSASDKAESEPAPAADAASPGVPTSPPSTQRS